MTGLFYLQSRYYDPMLRRFVSPDIYADTADGILGTNMYAYCHNDPVSFIDPNGENRQPLWPAWSIPAGMWNMGPMIALFSAFGFDANWINEAAMNFAANRIVGNILYDIYGRDVAFHLSNVSVDENGIMRGTANFTDGTGRRRHFDFVAGAYGDMRNYADKHLTRMRVFSQPLIDYSNEMNQRDLVAFCVDVQWENAFASMWGGVGLVSEHFSHGSSLHRHIDTTGASHRNHFVLVGTTRIM